MMRNGEWAVFNGKNCRSRLLFAITARALRMTEQWVHQPAPSLMHSWRAPSAWNGPQMEREVQNGLAAAAPRIALLPMCMYCNFIF
jgi:hypothetical protein